MKRIAWLIYDLANGWWTGLPWCCVLFFALERLRCPPDGLIAMRVALRRGSKWPPPLLFSLIVPYVRCDRCHAEGRVVRARSNGAILGRLVSKGRPWREPMVRAVRPEELE